MKINKLKFLFRSIILFVFFATSTKAQVPSSYEFSLRNDVQVSPTVYEFDMYLLNNDLVNVFELDLYQAGILVNPNIVNGGTITASIVPSSSDLVPIQQPTTGIQFASNCIKLANPGIAPHGFGTIIPTTSPGVRIARIRLTNTVPFGQFSPNLTFNFTASPYNSLVYAYNQTSPYLGVNITNQTFFTVSNLTNPVLNQTLTPLTISGVTAMDKVYNGTTVATLDTISASLVGVQGTDTVILISKGATGTFANKNVGTAKTVTTAGFKIVGADAYKYILTQPSLTANITAAGLTVTGITANNKVYDGTTAATLNTTSASLVGVISPDVVSLISTGATGTFSDKNIGTGKTVTTSGFTLSGADGGNYTLTPPTLSANITAAGLTVSGITASNKVYDGTTSATLNTTSASLVGVISPDVVTLNTASATGVFANKNVGTGKTVTVTGLTISGADAGNYTLTQPTVLANITYSASLTITGVTANNKVYDGTTTATLNTTSASLVGVISPDVVTLVTSGATGTFADKNVGNGIVVTTTGFTLSGTDAGNYSLTQPSLTANITAKPLTITANDLTKCYGTTVTFAGTEFTTSALVTGDAVSGVTISSAGAPSTAVVATYSIVPSLAVGSGLSNYSITYVNGTLTVLALPAKPVITLSADTLISSAPAGNQWCNASGPISGATSQKYIATVDGQYWTVVTINGCSSPNSDTITVLLTGTKEFSANTQFEIYPVPSNGQFTILLNSNLSEKYTIVLCNLLGEKIYEIDDVYVNGKTERNIDLSYAPSGIYYVKLMNGKKQITKKICINK
jgi:hypothetical protein